MPASTLLTDVFTFLAFLHAEDISPRGNRFLPPSALDRINRHLLHSTVERVTSERANERIRFIHFLCENAGLVARAGRFLKPTPRAPRWLTTSTFARANQLFAPAFIPEPGQQTKALADLWCAYCLPGWRLGTPHLALLALLRETPREETIRLSTLLKLLPLPFGDDPPEAILRGVLLYLEWFEVVEWQGASAIRLTDWGALLLQRPDAPPPLTDPPPSLLLLEDRQGEGFDLLAPPHAHLPTLYELGEYAELVVVKPQRRYRLDRARVQRALERGADLAHILHFLESATGDALPRALIETLQTWAKEFGRVTLRRVTLIEAREPELLRQLTRVRRIRNAIRRPLSENIAIIREQDLRALLHSLERHGITPRVEFPRPTDRAAKRPFDQPTLAHLYLAARLGHALPDLIPTPYRVPYAVLTDIEQQLAPRDRDLAAEIVEEVIAEIRVKITDSRRQTADADSSAVLHFIEDAIQAGAPLEIVYYTASRDETTTRVVEPRRIEWRGRTPYLVAYCRTRQDERVFRVDRIQQVRKVNAHPTT